MPGCDPLQFDSKNILISGTKFDPVNLPRVSVIKFQICNGDSKPRPCMPDSARGLGGFHLKVTFVVISVLRRSGDSFLLGDDEAKGLSVEHRFGEPAFSHHPLLSEI